MAAVNAFKQYAKKMEGEEQAKKAAQLAEREQKKLSAEAEAKRKADEERFGDIWSFADEKKKQYPNMPDNLYAQMRNCITKAEAKRIWKSHLVRPPEESHVDLGPRWMVPM